MPDVKPAPQGSKEDPLVLRPRLVRAVGWIGGAVVLVSMAVVAVIVPPMFSIVDRIGFVSFGVGVFWFCYREATVCAVAHPDHLVVRNLFSTRRLEWPEIIAVSFPQGDPWAHLDLADGDTLGVMALQRADGDRGINAARLLSRLVRERGEASIDG